MLIDPRNGEHHDLTSTAAAARTALIASTPRTGSTLLCRALWDTGQIGAPKEYLNPTQVRDWQVRLGSERVRRLHSALVGPLVGLAGQGLWTDDRLRRHLDGVRQRRSSPEGWFGIKLHHHHYRQWFEGPERDLDAWFPGLHVVRISREDRVGQAISWVRARQTGEWAADRPGQRTPRYRRGDIELALRRIERAERGWDEVLAGRGALHVDYAEVVGDLTGTVRRVLRHLGLDDDIDVLTPSLRAQADDVSAAWRARFRDGR